MISCKLCNVQIPPEWKFAISKNICPGCGEELLDEKSKELLDEVRAAFEKMPNDPEGLAGWLLSNYQLIKVGDGEPVNFHGRPKHQDPRTNQNVKVNSNNKVHQFLQRTGVADKINNRPSIKDIVNKMHNSIEEEEAEISGDYNSYDQYEDEGYDPYEAEYEQNRVRSSVKKAMANTWTHDNAPPPSYEEKEAIKAMMEDMSKAGPSFHTQSLHQNTNLHPALQADRANREYLSTNISSGVGKIRRSG